MSSNPQAQPSFFGRLMTFIFVRFLPLLLILAIVLTLLQVILVFSQSLARNENTASRQDDYAGTATAIAPQEQSMGDVRVIAQFATNTPEGGIPSETPPPTATDVPILPTVDPSLITLPTIIPPSNSELSMIAGTAVPPVAQLIPRNDPLVNIVLLGSDDEIVNDGTIRTDTMIIVSINTRTGTVAMLHLPRDLFVYVPTPTMTRINTVYGIGEAFGWDGGGFGLLRQAIFYNFGINVHYYAFIDISGLATVVDTVGGVDIAAHCPIQDFALVGATVPSAAIGPDVDAAYILPVGFYHFTGGEAVWYARSRGNSDDFDRGRRQLQLLRAIFRAARTSDQIAQVPELWGDITSIVSTDIPLNIAVSLMPIALNLDTSEIESFSIIKTYHTSPWTPSEGNFAGQNVHVLNPQTIYDLMVDFYTPPTASRLNLATASVSVYNGSTRENLDLVASERLREEGFSAVAMGLAETQDYSTSMVFDYAALDRGSPLPVIIDTLNIDAAHVTTQADPARTIDYLVIVGEDYNACNGNIVAIEQ
jgi:polyisoprenyl-teichoic acid--peptidoglycan teichoic acid transferase